MKYKFFLFLIILLFSCTPKVKEHTVYKIKLRSDGEFLRAEARYLNIRVPENEEVKRHLKELLKDKRGLELALERYYLYRPYIVPILKKYGIPEELSLLPVIESGFNPFAVSRSGAAGVWQLMPQTARRYGLKVNRYVDERFDVIKSTEAAARYMRDLYREFGSWDKVIAAYNCGEGCVRRKVKGNLWENLSKLPEQTRKYVPRFFALLLVARNPERFGIYPEFYKRSFVKVEVKDRKKVSEIISKYKISSSTFRDLNPHIKLDVIPEGTYVYIPEVKRVNKTRIKRKLPERLIEVRINRKVNKLVLDNGAVIYIKD